MDDFNKRFWDTFEQMQEDFDRFFDHYARCKRPSLAAFRTRWSPPCNVYEVGDAICILVEIAGMSRDAIEVCVEEEMVTLRGSREKAGPPARGNYQQMEILFGEFELEVPLCVPVDAESAQACYEDGFLYIMLPKIAETKTQRIKLSLCEK